MTASRPRIAGLTYSTISHRGNRDTNEDHYCVEAWQDGSALLVVIADGMGGQAGGKIASEVVVNAFKEMVHTALPEARAERYEKLLACFHEATRRIRARASTDFALLNMAATAIAAVVTPVECLVLYAGDCRFYHFRGATPLFVTRDHSVVRVLLDTGEITAEQAKDHPMRSLVTSSLTATQGGVLNVDPKWNEDSDEQPAFRQLAPGDTLLFCSDGLTGEIDPTVYVGLLDGAEERSDSPDALAVFCAGAALQAGGRDNVTVTVVKVEPENLVEESNERNFVASTSR